MARVCLIRQGYHPLDTRVRREIDALTVAGHEVDVICVRRSGQRYRERSGRVTVLRLPLSAARTPGPLGYVLRYAVFGLAAAAVAAALWPWRRWDVVQVNSMPDALVFAAIVPRLLGARVLLDLHESMPEFFQVKFGVGPRHPAVRLVAAAEQASIRFAHRVITCTEQMRAAFVARGARADKIAVVLNASDEVIFDARRHPPAPRRRDRFTLICHGAIERSYGHDTLVRAAALLRDEIPGLRVEIYGDGTYRRELQRLGAELGLDGALWVSDDWAPIEQLLAAIAAADAGVVAMRRDPFRDLTHCNKMFDFIAMRRPAIVSRTKAVEAYFGDDAFALFESGEEHDLARAIRELHADPDLGARLVTRAAEVGAPYRWEHQRTIYQRVVEELA
ncbi:MAG TPA: glycosyltransferase [Solirubrobacteraceae bacterium]|jgi:glycosyltransferase involved in cell wall biosynthesis|nr:glycosyltransferase [Solirubrobacteraceae bacterium]